jgi:MFS family permease
MNMEEKNSSKGVFTSYFKYLIFILILVQILDTYTTSFPTMIPSQIISEFLSDFSENVATAIFALITGIASAGMYICALNQYLSDKFGRKIMLIITIVGMVFVSLILIFSQSIIDYTIYLFVLWFFTRSDIWLIYINEEAPKDKRAVWTNAVLIVGMTGAILAPILRSVFITDEGSSNWRGLPLFTIILGVPLALLILFTLKGTKIYEEMKEIDEVEMKRIRFKDNFKNLMKSPNKSQVIALMVMSFVMGINSIFRNLVEQLLTSSPYLDQDQVNVVLFLASISVVFAFIIIGIFGDKIGRLPLLYIFAIMVPIARIIIAFGSTMPQGAFILSIVGGSLSEIGYWGEWVLISMVILEVVPTEARGTGAGLKSLAAAIGITIGFFLSSLITLLINLAMTFVILSLLLLLNILLIRKNLKETKHIDLKNVYETP